MPLHLNTDSINESQEPTDLSHDDYVNLGLATDTGEPTAAALALAIVSDRFNPAPLLDENADALDTVAVEDLSDEELAELGFTRVSEDTYDAANPKHVINGDVLEFLDPDDVAEVTDLDDLRESAVALARLLPLNESSDLATRAIGGTLADIAAIASGQNVSEGFKKGDFRKIRKLPSGPTAVNRMLGAMLFKGAIRRAPKPGSGYRAGDYRKDVGYSVGTPAGLKKVQRWIAKNPTYRLKFGKAALRKAAAAIKSITGGVKASVAAKGNKAALTQMAAKKAASKAKGAKGAVKGKGKAAFESVTPGAQAPQTDTKAKTWRILDEAYASPTKQSSQTNG